MWTQQPASFPGLLLELYSSSPSPSLRVGRLTAPRGKVQRANDLAEHREYERNLAQQELLRRLEEERELAKEKLQFESQLAEYEKYASLAQLALGPAHEINNPLLGIMSHLELERRLTSGDQRTEVEQCSFHPHANARMTSCRWLSTLWRTSIPS